MNTKSKREAIMYQKTLFLNWGLRSAQTGLMRSLVALLTLSPATSSSEPLPIVDPVTKGRLELAEGHLPEARRLCQRALHGKRQAEALACLGEVELARNVAQVHLAIELGTAALKIRGTIAIRLLLAGAYLKRGSCKLAREHLEQVLFIDPDRYAAQQMLSFCQAQANSTNKGSP